MDIEKEIEAVDVEYLDVEDEIYLTAPQIAQRIKDTDIRVRHWADVFGDLIGIEKLNGRKRYKESDVYKFAFIKDLLDNKNFKHDQAKVYIGKHGFKYAEYNSGLIDPKDPLGFQALASALSVEVDNKLNKFAEELLTNISNQLTESLVKQYEMNVEMKAEIEASVDEIVTEKMDTKISELKAMIDVQELQAKVRDQEILDLLKKGMEERNKLTTELKEKEKNKGFFGKIFGK